MRVVQQMFQKSIGTAGVPSNSVVLFRLNDKPGLPSHFQFDCAILFTTATTPDTTFYGTTGACGRMFLVTIEEYVDN